MAPNPNPPAASTDPARKPKGRKAKKQQPQAPAQLATQATPSADAADASQQPDSAVDGPTCWICAEPVRYYALSECNHRTCHVCCLRLRALYKKRECTFCKAPQPSVVQTVSPDAPYESYTPESTPFKDDKLEIRFESQEMMEDTLLLLRFNCPDQDCTFFATGWSDLKQHVRATHKKSMCHICIGAKKIFAHEHTLYTNAELAIHVPSIRRREKLPQGASLDVEGGVHPLCEFCNECFFSDEELYPHMRDRHEKCFVCERDGHKFNYFRNYEELEAHFSNAHYPCSHPTCREQKFVVFGTQMDLKAHTIEAHGADLSTKDKRDARRVLATSDFGFQAPTPTGSSTTSRRRNGFGAQLTLERSETATPSAPVPPPQPRREEPPEHLEPAQAAQQAAFLARFSPGAAMAMHASMRSFRASECSARDVISTLWNVLERDIDATGSHVAALVDAFPDEKRKELLQSWNDFKLEQRREFPDLLPRPAAQGTEYAGITAGRVLNVKHSTTARSGAQSRRVWDRVAQAAASTSGPTPGASSSRPQQDNRFPALATAATARASGSGGHHTPWISSAATPPPPPAPAFRPPAPASTARPPDPKPPGPPRKAPQLNNAAFPSLPSSGPSTAQSLRQQGFLSGNASVRNIVGATPQPAPGSAWGARSNNQPANNEASTSVAGAAAETAGANANADGGGGGKGKKKGKQKQTLFTLGAFPV